MNHIYKSIFNKALGVFTAVPEFASAHGKGSERTVVGRVAKGTAGFAASALAISIGLALTSTSAVAGPGIYINDGKSDDGCLALPDASGPNVGIYGISNAGGGINVSILAPGQVAPNKDYFAMNAMAPCLSSGNAAQALDTQTNRTLFYGNDSYGHGTITNNGAKNLTLGGRLDVNSGIIGVGDRGTNGAGATNSIRMGTGTTLDEANKVANSISIGVDAGASADNAIAMGKSASAAGQRTIAMGENALAGNEASMALGYNSSAKGLAQVSIGQGAGTLKNTTDSGAADATFIGNYAGADSASPIGNLRGVAVGTNAGRNLVSGVHNIAVGYDAGKSIEGSNNVAIGYNAGSNVNGDLNFAGGREAGNSVKGEKNIALGYISGQNIEGNDNTTVGYSSGNNVTGWGNFAGASKAGQFVEGYNNVAIGYQAGMGTADNLLKTSGGVSISTNSKAKTSFSIAIGDSSSAGDDSTGAHGGGRLAIAIGQNANANFYHAIALGHSSRVSPATGQSAEDGIAIGSGALVDNYKGIAVGAYSRAKGRQSTVIANNVRDSNYSTASGDRSQVYGAETTVSGNNSVAIGDTNTVASARTYAIGNNINVAAGADDSLVFGTQAAVGAANTVAIGANANAAQANSVALGAGSATDAPHTGDYTLNGSYTAAGLPNAANGTVSVGSAGKERQIQNVAAGVISATSTDAINGSQLYATNNYLTNFAGDVATKLGGNAALDNDGHLTMTNIGGTGKDNVNDAIAAANTKVAEGENITVTPTTNADGSKTYTVATKKDLVVDSVKAGDSTLNTDGLTIANGPSITKSGINANGRKVTGVVDGDINATSTDAVNGSQLHATNTKLADVENTANTAVQEIESANPTALSVKKDGTKVTLTPNFIAGDLVDPTTGAVNTPAAGDEGKLVTAGTVAKALAETHFVVDTKATTDGELDGASQADQKIKSGNKVTLQAGKNLKAKQTNAADGAQVEFSLKDSISLTQVTAGDSTLNTDGLTIAGGPSVTKTGGINAGGKKITGVANGNVAAGSTDAVNGGQLAEVKSKADSAVQNVVSANPTALTATKAGDTVTLTPNFIAGDLVNADGTVNAPAAADEGKLVSAKAVADALKANHFVVDTKANGGKTEAGSEADAKVGSSNKVTFEAGKNLTAKQANTANGGATVKFSLQDDISLNSVTAGTGDSQVVLNDAGVNVGNKNYINKDGLNANGNKVANVKAGDVSATSTDAVNGAQLHNVATSVANVLGGNAAVDGNGNVTSSNIGGTGVNTVDDAIKAVNATAAKHTTVVEGKNVKVTKGKNAAGGDEYTVATKDDLDVTSVTAGNTTVNTNGLTITGGPSVTRGGIDAGDRVISGVKAGDVSANSKEAVNGSQLYATNTKLDGVKAKADTAVQDVKSGDENALTAVKDPNTNIVTVTPKLSGDLVDADGNITAPTTPADKGKLVTAGTVAQALANTHFVVDTKATDGELDSTSQADQKIKAGNKVTLQAGKNLKAKQTNGTDGAQVEFSLKDSISLTQVTAGTGDNQVVLGNDGVQVGGNTYINKDGLNANNKVISNVADGVNPNDAVNKGQLDAVKGVADSAVKSVDVVANENNLVVDNTDPKNPKLRLRKAVDLDSIKLENNVGEKSFLNSAGLTIKDGPAVTRSGINANNTKVTNVTDGDVNGTSKDAVNGSQLYNVASNVKDLIGPDAAIDPATGKVTVADPTKGIGGTGKGNIGDAIQSVKDAADKAAAEHTTVKAGNNIVVTEGTNAAGGKEYTVSTAKDLNVDSVKAGDTTVNNDGLTIAGGPSVKKDGIDAGDKNITNVADGNVAAGSKDAVNGGQLYDVAKNVADLVGPDATIDPATGKVTVADPTKGIGETGKGTIGDAIKAVNDLAKKAAAEKTSVKAKDGRSNVTVTEGTNAAGGHEYTVDVERAVTEAGSDQVTVTSKHDADSNTTTYTVDVSDKTKASLAKADSAVQGLTSKDGNLNFNKDPNGNVEVSFNDNLNVKNITADGVKAGDTTINSNGIEIVNGPSMTKDGINAGSKAITNVANGNLAKGSTDAVNGGQLHDTAQSVADVIGGGATVKDGKVVAGQNGIGNTGQNTVHGAIAAINQNTANNFNQIRGDLRKMDRDLRGGIAGALATAGLPQAFRPGKSMVAAAASTYRGQSGLAIGVSRISDNGKVILKVTGNTNSRGDFGGTIGAGYQW